MWQHCFILIWRVFCLWLLRPLFVKPSKTKDVLFARSITLLLNITFNIDHTQAIWTQQVFLDCSFLNETIKYQHIGHFPEMKSCCQEPGMNPCCKWGRSHFHPILWIYLTYPTVTLMCIVNEPIKSFKQLICTYCFIHLT
jgi:hypothetical protein